MIPLGLERVFREGSLAGLGSRARDWSGRVVRLPLAGTVGLVVTQVSRPGTAQLNAHWCRSLGRGRPTVSLVSKP